jgi:pimeloyl-ACP methyl ester carboxylesterase
LRCAPHCSRSTPAYRGWRSAFVWTGNGAPTLEQRRKKLPQFLTSKRRPIDRAFVYSIFERDHPETAEKRVVDAFADAILSLDDSMPNGTYIDMCSKLPIVDPARISAPTLIMRGEFDGIVDRVFQTAARGQAIHGDARHFPRELPARTISWSTICCMPGSLVPARSHRLAARAS